MKVATCDEEGDKEKGMLQRLRECPWRSVR